MSTIAFFTQAYNSDKYLEKCIKSVLRQSFADFTYYLCDNGSADHTRSIIKRYAERDSRIVPIYVDKNEIVLTYNEVLKTIYATDHRYFVALDSDDWYEPQFAQAMVEAAEQNNADITVCGSQMVSEKNRRVVEERAVTQRLVLARNDYPAIFPQIHVLLRSIWGKLFRLDRMRENEAFLPDWCSYGGDTIFVMNCLSHAKHICVLPDVLHNYLLRTASVSRRYDPNRVKSDILLWQLPMQVLGEIGTVSELNRAFLGAVYVNAINDSATMLLNADCTTLQRAQGLLGIVNNDTTKQVLQDVQGTTITTQRTLNLGDVLALLSNMLVELYRWSDTQLSVLIEEQSQDRELMYSLADIMTLVASYLNNSQGFIDALTYKFIAAHAVGDTAQQAVLSSNLAELGIKIES